MEEGGKKILSFYLDEELVQRFRAVTRAMGLATENVIEVLLAEWLENFHNRKCEMQMKIVSRQLQARRRRPGRDSA